MFAFYIASYDKRKVGCHTLNDNGHLTINHGIIVEKSWNFISYFLWKGTLMISLNFSYISCFYSIDIFLKNQN